MQRKPDSNAAFDEKFLGGAKDSQINASFPTNSELVEKGVKVMLTIPESRHRLAKSAAALVTPKQTLHDFILEALEEKLVREGLIKE